MTHTLAISGVVLAALAVGAFVGVYLAIGSLVRDTSDVY